MAPNKTDANDADGLAHLAESASTARCGAQPLLRHAQELSSGIIKNLPRIRFDDFHGVGPLS